MSKSPWTRGILAASFLAVYLVISYPLTATAQLTLSRMVWDFESLEQGESKTQKIVLTNSGDQPVTVEKVELPDGCSITPDLVNKEIPAKEELEVEVTFDSQGLPGRLQVYVYLILSDETIVPLTITGEVFAKAQPRLQVTPTTWDFGTVEVGEDRQRTFRCKNVGTADLELENVQIYDSKFRVLRNITKETLPPGEEVDFAVSVNPTYAGKCETDFYVKSNSAGREYTKVSIKGYAVNKSVGVVVSSDLSSVENNTPYKVEVTRTDAQGKEEALTVERDSRKAFQREPGTERTPPRDYTLTIKVVRPSPARPAPKPAETQAPGEETAPPAQEKPEQQPDQPGEEEAVSPPEKAAPETPPEESPSEPEKEEPSEGPAPPQEEETAPAKPEEPEAPEAPEKEEEAVPEKPEPEKEATPPPEQEVPEKPPAEPGEDESPEKPGSPPAPEPGGSPASPESPEKPSGEVPSPNR